MAKKSNKYTLPKLIAVLLLICLAGGMIVYLFKSDKEQASAETFASNSGKWVAPSWTDTLGNPMANEIYSNQWGGDAKRQNGESLYNTYCATCHGKDGFGGTAPGMAFEIQPANFHERTVIDEKDGALFWKIKEGRGQMPPFGGSLKDNQIWEIVTYIRHLENTIKTREKKSRLSNLQPVENYSITPGIGPSYFPLPVKLTNVVKSDVQDFMVDTLISDLKTPWSMVFFPDEKTIMIAERSGKIKRYENGKLTGTVKLNEVDDLRDIKIGPKFKSDSLIYYSYYINPVKSNGNRNGGYTVLARATLVGDKFTNQKILYKAGPYRENGFWFGSKIAFDKSDHVYFTVGIRGKRENAQDLSNSSGKTMRFNIDGSIPKDNPFVGVKNALPEIYTYGHRVHEGLTYDEKTNELWSTEFGELGGDEINILKPGANFGWPEVTFSLEYSGKIITKDSLRSDIESPVYHMNISPSDLCFLEGTKYPGWSGNDGKRNLFIGAFRKTSPFLSRAVFNGHHFISEEELLDGIGRIRDVKVGYDGLLYLMTEDDGLLIRLIPVAKK